MKIAIIRYNNIYNNCACRKLNKKLFFSWQINPNLSNNLLRNWLLQTSYLSHSIFDGRGHQEVDVYLLYQQVLFAIDKIHFGFNTRYFTLD